MTARPLVLVGAGGFARETAALVVAINHQSGDRWALRGFVDDDPALFGRVIGGVPVLGPVDRVLDDDSDAAIVVCVGNPQNYRSRPSIVDRLDLPRDRYATLIHPSAQLARTSVGAGSVVHAACVATCDVEVGEHVAVMPAVVFTHDDVIGDHVTIGAGVRLAGGVTVDRGAYLGSGALVREQRRIGARSLIGMGAVVTSDVPPDEIWVGVPARYVGPARGGRAPTDLFHESEVQP